jgi:hypothetical protein
VLAGVRRDDGAAEAVAHQDEPAELQRVGGRGDVRREAVDRVIAVVGDVGFAHPAQVERGGAATRGAKMLELRRPPRAAAAVS